MSRNDAGLITGLSSAATRRANYHAQQRSKDNQRQGAELKPHAEFIKDEITKLRNEITDEARNIIQFGSTNDEIRAITQGAKWADGKLESLLLRLQNNVRAQEKA